MSSTDGPPPELTSATVTITSITQAVLEAPVVHIDGAHSIIAHDQVIKINLYQDRMLSGVAQSGITPVERVICTRLVMSPTVAKQLSDWLASNLRGLVTESK